MARLEDLTRGTLVNGILPSGPVVVMDVVELIIRGDLKRCLICCPGNLAEQWQDEMSQKFQIPFEIISRQSFQDALTGNPFVEKNLVISRLDHLSRNEDVQAKLQQTEWDLIIVDEAHKMSASFFGGELKMTKRYRLTEKKKIFSYLWPYWMEIVSRGNLETGFML